MIMLVRIKFCFFHSVFVQLCIIIIKIVMICFHFFGVLLVCVRVHHLIHLALLPRFQDLLHHYHQNSTRTLYFHV